MAMGRTHALVWESTPGFSLAFGVRKKGRHDAEWWFQTASHAAISDASGPPIAQGQWVHVAMVWNAQDTASTITRVSCAMKWPTPRRIARRDEWFSHWQPSRWRWLRGMATSTMSRSMIWS